jgi:hypothetical protein
MRALLFGVATVDPLVYAAVASRSRASRSGALARRERRVSTRRALD